MDALLVDIGAALIPSISVGALRLALDLRAGWASSNARGLVSNEDAVDAGGPWLSVEARLGIGL